MGSFIERLAFNPPKNALDINTVLHPEHKTCYTQGADLQKLYTKTGVMLLQIKNSLVQSNVALFVHGNGDTLGSVGKFAIDLARDFRSEMFCLEFPGYLKDEPPPSDASLKKAAIIAATFLSEKYRNKPLIIIGYSLGSCSALAAATQLKRRSATLLLFAPPCSAIATKIPLWLRFVYRWFDHFDSYALAPQCAMPATILHGTKDDIIHVNNGRVLSTRIPNCNFVEVPGVNHLTVIRPSTRQAFVQGVLAKAQQT